MDYINIQDVAKQLNISRMTVYNKLKNREIYKELKPHLKTIKKVRYFDNKGIELLKKHITVKDSSKTENEIDSNNDLDDNSNDEYKKLSEGIKDLQVNFINNLKDQIKQLQNQVNEKDKQIMEHLKQLNTKDKQLDNKDELLRNFQVLLKNEQENIKLLKEDNKKNANTIWNRLFGKQK
jgi:hypothetical protein